MGIGVPRSTHIYKMENVDMWIYNEKVIPIGEVAHLLQQGYDSEVDSPDGWVRVNAFIDKGIYQEYVLKMNDPKYKDVRCNADHLFETRTGWISAKDLVDNGIVDFLTRNGYASGFVSKYDSMIPIVDINVEHKNHRYYTEDISSHNTGVGKTLAMCHFAAANMMLGKNVLYITMEMAEEKIAERIDANLLNVSCEDLAGLSKDLYETKVSKVRAKTVGKLIIKEYPTAPAHVGHFRHLLNELNLKRTFKPDIIYLDYLNISMSSRVKPGANINSYTYIKSIAEELRGLAVEFNVPIVSATQTTRSGFSNSDPDLTDTSESFGLPATADFMIALISSEELQNLNQIMIKQLKNRYNDLTLHSKFVVGIDRSKFRLYDVEQSAQEDLIVDKPAFDKSKFGSRANEEDSMRWATKKMGRKDFSGFK